VQDVELGGTIRALRHRRGWRQVDLARRAGVSASLVGCVERGQVEGVSIRSVRKVAASLGVRLGWDAGYRGAELARLCDADHAGVADMMLRRLRHGGWLAEAEVSFNSYGDRGRIDVLAWHPASGTLAVIEIKTVIADVQDALGLLDVKRRLAVGVARSLGWRASVAVPVLIVAAGSTNRRRVDAHADLFAGLELRGRPAQAWLRVPNGRPKGVLLFVEVPHRSDSGLRKAGRQRVRRSASVPSVREPAAPPVARRLPG
jgi:transcriptional regulator with XRE-family HTH domain